MKKAVGAILWHCTDMKDIEVHHQFCQKEESSWCKYQRDKIIGEKKDIKPISIFQSGSMISSNQFL